MIEKPRGYQQKAIDDTFKLWDQHQNVLLVAPTGAGKTVIESFMSKILLQRKLGFVVVFAHRDVLLSQISTTLGKCGVYHKLLCSKKTESEIGNIHMMELNRCYLDPNSRVIVASVPTWVKRDTSNIKSHVCAWLLDEAHHLIKDSMWHKAIEGMDNAVGLGLTATPKRADKKGLGAHSDGVFDTILLTKTTGELIESGSLSPYKIYTIPTRLDLSDVNITSSGDFNQKKLAKATDKAEITGDAVREYLRLAKGKQAITFAVSIEHAHHIADQFNNAGIPSVALSSKTNDTVRHREIQRFKNGEILNLVNVDLFGEGFDVPAVEVVIMLRKTMSYALFKQMFGRMLRVKEGKLFGILIDHVGNVREHCIYGEPHDDPEWTLDSEKKRSSSDDGGVLVTGRTCPECFGFYIPKSMHPSHLTCPYCMHTETDDQRNQQTRELKIVEGDLVEYTSEYLNKILALRDKVDEPIDQMKSRMSYAGAPSIAINSAVSKKQSLQQAQHELRQIIIEWCEEMAFEWGWDIETTQRMFEHYFNITIFKAQTISAAECEKLTNEVKNHGKDERPIIQSHQDHSEQVCQPMQA